MKSKLETLSPKDIETITRKTMRKKNVPLVISKTPRIALDENLTNKLEVLSSAEGVSSDTLVNRLLKEDVDRLWKKYRRVG